MRRLFVERRPRGLCSFAKRTSCSLLMEQRLRERRAMAPTTAPKCMGTSYDESGEPVPCEETTLVNEFYCTHHELEARAEAHAYHY